MTAEKLNNYYKVFKILIDFFLIPFRFNTTWSRNNINNAIDNEIIFIMKQYIYNARCQQKSLHINALVNIIRDNYNVQKHIGTRNGKQDGRNGNLELIFQILYLTVSHLCFILCSDNTPTYDINIIRQLWTEIRNTQTTSWTLLEVF